VVKELDPRLTPARPDLAARHLEGRLAAARFVSGTTLQVVDAQAPLRIAATPDALLATEALMGEKVTVYESTEEGWAWGQLETDGYVGFLPANALSPPGPPATHKVAAPRTLVFPGPSLKLPPTMALSLGCRVAIVQQAPPWAITATGGYVHANHLARLDQHATDMVAVAEQFVGVPYLWGGKTSFGLDCSGLVQVALQACGIIAPRDSDMQEAALGGPIDQAAKFERGDLIFWNGHVAMVRDSKTLLHANAFHMAVAVEPIEQAIARIRAAGSAISSVRRIART
jgi:cell wall-associated NlpC family hydrolase